jgi:hypothetical protein
MSGKRFSASGLYLNGGAWREMASHRARLYDLGNIKIPPYISVFRK